MDRRRLAASALLLGVSAAVSGVAASLALTTGSIGANRASTDRCTTGALSVLPVLSGASVGSVIVTALPAGCGGAALNVTVDNGVATGSGSVTVPAGGGSVTIPITGGPALTTAIETDILLVGP